MNGSRNKIGVIGDLQPGLNSKIFKVQIISTGKLVASQPEMIPTNSFYLGQVDVFRLRATLSLTVNRAKYEGSLRRTHVVQAIKGE